jgi:miniconductance mechanosensitive channel
LQKTRTRFDDLVTNKTAKYIAHLIPLLFIYKSVPIILEKYEYWKAFLEVGKFTLILILWIIRTIFNALRDYLKLKPRYSDKPIDSFIRNYDYLVDSGYHYYNFRLFVTHSF